MTSRLSPGNRPITIAVVGDIHDQWSRADGEALKALGIDLVLFVGDIGNEAVGLVRQIAALDMPKAVILGNHDAWYSATEWGRKKCPYDRATEDRVQQQLDTLGTCHVGYGKLDLEAFELTVVGGRPFSWGGAEWKNVEFYQRYYGIAGFAASAARMKQAADEAAFDQLIFIGHCGPTGLGAAPEDPCGRDWEPLGGDYGDPDLAEAIQYAKAMGKTVPLVTFGHMHHSLRHRQDRQRRSFHRDAAGTFYLNAAKVPRWVEVDGVTRRNFSLVSLLGGEVRQAALVWVDDHHRVVQQEVVFATEPVSSMLR